MRQSRMRLEFAPGARSVSPLGVSLLAAALLLLGLSGARLAQALSDQARAAEELAGVQAALGTATAKSRPASASPGDVARGRALRQVAQTLTTPWADLLESLESAPIHSVALLSIEPSVGKRSVRLTAEARTSTAMLDYVGSLQRDGRLVDVVLLSHEVQAKLPGTPLRFQLQASWGTPE